MPKCSVERARMVLEENPRMFLPERRYFEAVVNGTLPDYCREKLRSLRDDYSDKTPPVDVRELIDNEDSPVRSVQYKCQSHYIINLRHTLQTIVGAEIVDSDTCAKINRFLKKNLEFTIGDPGNQRKIRKINRIIGTALESIDK